MTQIVFHNNIKFLIYTEQDIKDAFSYVANIPEVVNPRLRPKRDSKYLVFSIDDIDFIIRMSDRTSKPAPYIEWYPIYLGVRDVWCIDTLVGKYKPKDLPIIINNLRNAIQIYNSKKWLTIIKVLVKNLPTHKYGMNKDTVARDLVAKVMNENHINEDRLGVSHIVLEGIIKNMLGK